MIKRTTNSKWIWKKKSNIKQGPNWDAGYNRHKLSCWTATAAHFGSVFTESFILMAFRRLWLPAARMWDPVSTRLKMWKYFDKYAFGSLFPTTSVSREWVWNIVTAYESWFSNYTWHSAWLWAWQDTRWWQERDVHDTGFAILVKIF